MTRDDIVVTQDFGLASMVIGKGARAINQNGLVLRTVTWTNSCWNAISSKMYAGAAAEQSGVDVRVYEVDTIAELEEIRFFYSL